MSGLTATRAVFLLGLGFGLAAAVGCGRGGTEGENVATTDRVPVTLRAVERGAIRALVQASGVVKAAPGAELSVMAPQQARILEMPKAAGDAVRQGDLLIRFEIPALNADAAARRADVARAEARLVTARAAEARVAGLFQRGIAAKREVEDARRELADAEAALAEARSARAAAGALAGREVVRAPWSGVVASRQHSPGDLVEAGGSDPILRLIDPSRLEVQAEVPLTAVSRLTPGSPAEIRGPGGAAPEAATLLGLPAAADSTTGAASVRLTFARPSRLPAETPVDVEIAGIVHESALVVPAAAVVEEGPQSFLFTVDAAGKAHRRAVVVGIVAGGRAEILSGVRQGESVVVSGQDALPDGAAVVVQPSGARQP